MTNMQSESQPPSTKDRERCTRVPPREHELRWWGFYTLTRISSWVSMKIWLRVKVHQAENIPPDGAAILASNHQSFLDPWLLGGIVRRPLCFLARKSLFSVPVLGYAIRRLGAFEVDREKTSAREGMRVCLRILDRGRLLVFFPEGTRSPDGKFLPFKRGLAFIAKRSESPVVPTLIVGTYEAWPRDKRFPRLGAARVVFGAPIKFTKEDSTESFLERLRLAQESLAREAGAEHLLPERLGPGGDEDSSPICFQSLEEPSTESAPN